MQSKGRMERAYKKPELKTAKAKAPSAGKVKPMEKMKAPKTPRMGG